MNLKVLCEPFKPCLDWWPKVKSDTIRADFIAGLTAAVIALPQGVAFAMIAGMPPQYGLYTSIVPAIIAALFGSSYHLVSGPTTGMSIVVFSTLSPLASPGTENFVHLAFTLALIAGIFQLSLGLAKLGSLINFVSHTVVTGFIAGAATLIFTNQAKHVFGIHVASGTSFLNTWASIVTQLPNTNPYALILAMLSLSVAIGFKIYRPHWPGMLIAMIVGSVCAALLDAEAHHIRLVGSLPAQLPPLSWPATKFSFATWKELVAGGLALAMLGLVQTISIARSIAARSKQRISTNQEFIGQGLANICGAFFSSYASSASFMRTGVSYSAGAKTPLAAILASVCLALILLLIAPITAYLPIPVVSGVLLLIAYDLINIKQISTIMRTSQTETSVMVITFLSTLLLDLEFSIYVGVLFSLFLYLRRTSKPSIVTLAPDWDEVKHTLVSTADKPASECSFVRIIRIDGSLFFGAIAHVTEFFTKHELERPTQRHILLICSSINFIDLAGVQFLIEEAERLKTNGGNLYLSNLKPKVQQEVRRLGLLERVEYFEHKSEAIQTIFLRLDKTRCLPCKQVFFECEATHIHKLSSR